MSETVYSKIIELLDSLKIKYEIMEHEPVHTSEQASQVRKSDLKSGMKAMVLRSKGKFFMVVVSGDKKIDMKKFRKFLGIDRLAFATPDEVKQVTDCVIGSVPPFGNIFNIPVYADKAVERNMLVNFNAGLHTKSLKMELADWLKAVKPTIADFSQDI